MDSRRLGIAAFVQLRLLLKRETEGRKRCKPGETIEIVGLGSATVDRSGVKSTARRHVPTRGVGRTGSGDDHSE